MYEKQRCPATGYSCRACPIGLCSDLIADPLTPTPDELGLRRGSRGEKVITVIDLGTGQEMGDIVVPESHRTKVFS